MADGERWGMVLRDSEQACRNARNTGHFAQSQITLVVAGLARNFSQSYNVCYAIVRSSNERLNLLPQFIVPDPLLESAC